LSGHQGGHLAIALPGSDEALIDLLNRLCRHRLCRLVAAAVLSLPWHAAMAGEASDEFDRQLFKSRFEHEVAFREAAIHVAWGAEPLCDDTTEVEPFSLWSTHTMRKALPDRDRLLLKQATGMDDQWRIVWLDESAPDELKLGDAVAAINDRSLGGGSTHFDMVALLRGGSPLSVDDQGYWALVRSARQDAVDGKPMVLTLADGRRVKVPTQTGCAGSVTATAFDTEPERLVRHGVELVKLPGNALMEARSRDEYRWLAAFGTYFMASEHALVRQQKADGVGTAFLIGRILTVTVPGAGLLLSAVEDQTQREIMVDGLVGGADLFANEVTMALGGDPSAGLRLNDRLRQRSIAVDVVHMTDFRRSNVALHVGKLQAIAAAREKAEREEARREEAVQRDPATPDGGKSDLPPARSN
jgi:hypothetical protein